MLNEDDHNELIIINERIYQVFSFEEKNEIIQHELYRTSEHWHYIMFKLGLYNIEQDILMNDLLFSKLFFYTALSIIGLMFLNEAKFIIWNLFDMFRTRHFITIF